jgi:uncharacterized protein (DUF2384 family)
MLIAVFRTKHMKGVQLLPNSSLILLQDRLLGEIKSALSEFYDEAGVQNWLSSPHEMLDWCPALELVKANRGDEVLTLIHGLSVGAYL